MNKSIRAALEPGDVLLYLGAGDITQAAREMAGTLRGEPVSAAADCFSRLRALVSPQTVLLAGEPLARRTTLRVGGKADYYAEPASESELARLILFCREERSSPHDARAGARISWCGTAGCAAWSSRSAIRPSRESNAWAPSCAAEPGPG